MAVTSAAGLGRPRRWAAGLAWMLWALAMLGLAVVPWMDRLIIRAGRPDLAAFVPGSVVGPVLAVLSAATIGAAGASMLEGNAVLARHSDSQIQALDQTVVSVTTLAETFARSAGHASTGRAVVDRASGVAAEGARAVAEVVEGSRSRSEPPPGGHRLE